MTTKRMSEPDFDTLLTAWFEADARVREPETLVDDALVRVQRSRRLPSWLLPEWWIPMQLSTQARAVPRLATMLLVVLLLVAALVAIAVVGSTPRLPNPFGLAANGRVAYLANGQIYASNPDGSNPIPLTSGIRSAATPVWSRDGTKFAYKLISPKPGTADSTKYGDIVVADADGSNLITIDRETEDPSPPVWSPDGRWLVYSKVTGTGDQIFIAAADGSSLPVRIGDHATVNWAPIFSPDGSKVMYFVGYSGNGIGVMNTDGSDRADRQYDAIRGGRLGDMAPRRQPDRRLGAHQRGIGPVDPVPRRVSRGTPRSHRQRGRAQLVSRWEAAGLPHFHDRRILHPRSGRRRWHQRANAAWRLQPHQSVLVAGRPPNRGRERSRFRRACDAGRSGRPGGGNPDRGRPSSAFRHRHPLLPDIVAAGRAVSLLPRGRSGARHCVCRLVLARTSWIVWRLVKDGLFTLYRMRPDGSERHALLTSTTFVARNIDWGPAALR